ncbi:hypothetical protein BKA69DRAFT_1047165 [Paraphysoderma sedebokerense]|nr:hypothetical protein BKA69DRAFT_1047165 [Paraphysoderma sedebokerense]
MTHLSDFSYLERGMISSTAFCWILLRIYWAGGLSVLNPKPLWQFLLNPRQGTAPLRLIITYLFLLSCFTHSLYDFLTTKMKYEEGYSYNSILKKCVTKEGKDYSPENKILLDATNTLLSLTYCTKSTASFLLIAFWSHTGTQIGLKKAFVSSRESRVCSIWAIISVCLYPLLQYIFISNKLLSTIAPQFLYHAETFMVACLSTVVHFRLQNSIQDSAYGFSGVAILRHHMQYNVYFIILNTLDVIGLGSINVDAVGLKMFDKLLLDIFIKLYSTGSTGAFLVMTEILYPQNVRSTASNTRNSHHPLSHPSHPSKNAASSVKLQQLASGEVSKSNQDLQKAAV